MISRKVGVLIGVISTFAIVILAFILLATTTKSKPSYSVEFALMCSFAVVSLLYYLFFDFFEEPENTRVGILKLLADILYVALALATIFFVFACSGLSFGGVTTDPVEDYEGSSLMANAILFMALSYPLLPVVYTLVYFKAEEPRKFYPFINLGFFLFDYILSIVLAAVFFNNRGVGKVIDIVYFILTILAFLFIHVRKGLPFCFQRKKRSYSNYAPTASEPSEEEEKTEENDDRAERGGFDRLKKFAERYVLYDYTGYDLRHLIRYEPIRVKTRFVWCEAKETENPKKFTVYLDFTVETKDYVKIHLDPSKPQEAKYVAKDCAELAAGLIKSYCQMFAKDLAAESSKLVNRYKDVEGDLRIAVLPYNDIKFLEPTKSF